MKNSNGKGFFSHAGLFLLAFVIAFLVWFMVMNVEDSIITKNINDIPVEMLNGDTILENGKLYNVVDGETVDIVVKGPRSVVERLEAANFDATADLSHLSVTNSTTINVRTNSTVNLKSGNKITINPVNQFVTLSIEDEVKKSIPVKVITTGNVKEGCAPGSAVPTPNMITVSGPESVLSNIVEARAVVSVSNAEDEVSTIASVGCIDGYGSAVLKDNISLSVNEVSVTIPIYKTKEVPVTVNPVGTVHEGYGIKAINFEPSSVVVAAEDDVLESIKSIDIYDVVVTDATDNIEKNVDINLNLPNNVILADSDMKEIAINVVIEQLSEQEISIGKGNVALVKMNNDLEYEIINPETLKVKLEGFAEDMEGVTVDDLDPRASVDGLGVGTHEVTVEFNDPKDYTIKGTYTIRVVVKEKETEEEEQ